MRTWLCCAALLFLWGCGGDGGAAAVDSGTEATQDSDSATALELDTSGPDTHNLNDADPTLPTNQSAHNTGASCCGCHSEITFGGTVFGDAGATATAEGVSVSLTDEAGDRYFLSDSMPNGNTYSYLVEDGRYLVRVGAMQSRTWHSFPEQKCCADCHVPGGNGSASLTDTFPSDHTAIPSDNDCTNCHHYPATRDYGRLATEGVLDASKTPPDLPDSRVYISTLAGDLGTQYDFDPLDQDIEALRDDVFAPGWYSMFDVLLAVAQEQGIAVEYAFDETRQTHFVTEVNGVAGDYWYGFSFDTPNETQSLNEFNYTRQLRWDETLWRPGVWIWLVPVPYLDQLKAELLAQIQREQAGGATVGQVRIMLNPTDYDGNPGSSGRVTVSKQWDNVAVMAHNWRSIGYESPYSKPFQPGVITSLDILLSLRDQGELSSVEGVFYDRFGHNFIDSYYVVELGFPVEGVAHSSGRHGFTYHTESGGMITSGNQMHITSDVAVLHAPDSSQWRWTELGDPYYESVLPNPTMLQATILDDYAALGNDFNLHEPTVAPADKMVHMGINIFEPGFVHVQILDAAGALVANLEEREFETLGIHSIDWDASSYPSGDYRVVARRDAREQIRAFALR